MSDPQPGESDPLILRHPQTSDGAALHTLIASCPPLDLNSLYAYLLQCHHHSPTCLVAESLGELAGAITAYVPPAQPDVLFIWQVAVASRWQGQGLAKRMLEHLFQQVAEGKSALAIQYLEATISPDNLASQKLFLGFARRHGVECTSSPLFSASHFGGSSHEEEWLYRVGPC